MDREGLLDLADDLQNCEITLKATGRLTQINSEDRLVKILKRCPGYVKSRWQSRVQEIRKEDRDPNIEDVRKLIRKIATEKNDSAFGSIMDSESGKFTTRDKNTRRSGKPGGRSPQQRSMNFSIQTEETKDRGVERNESNVKCKFCEKDHKMEQCVNFKSKSGEEQFEFVRSKKLCDNCLSPFHFSAGCKRRKECTIPGFALRRKHITSLHESISEFEQRPSAENMLSGRQQMQTGEVAPEKKKSQFFGVTSHIGAGCGSKALSIVPVKVKGHGERKVITTYALLDNGSTASFCTDNLLKELGLQGKRCQLTVATISNVESNSESSIASLDVMDLKENVFIELPSVFSTKTLNVSPEAITKQDVNQWPYLSKVKLPAELPNGEVSILIGVDVPEALQPDEIIKAQQGGPYAVRTKFGWTLNGPMGRLGANGKHCYHLNSSYDDLLNEQLRKYFNQEFNESFADENKIDVCGRQKGHVSL